MCGVSDAQGTQVHAVEAADEFSGVGPLHLDEVNPFATEDGPKSLPELFEGRSQLLIYHLMFGED